MSAYLLDWLALLGRWAHLVTGIAWIGASFYFVWLDDHLLPPQRKDLVDAGVGGELWAMHGGGFYNAQKYKLAPAALPEPLHWFYWEAYSTWLTGFFLLCLLYFGQPQVYLIDPAVLPLGAPAAIGIALAFLAGGWLAYDALCRLLGRNERALAIAVGALCCVIAFGLCAIFSGRGAYILFGATLGTMMVANVFFVIIPGQREIVKAKQQGRAPDPVFGTRGKQRSVHNTYFTLPVVFAMLSNHYAMTYTNKFNWVVLVLIMLAGALIRQFFVMRHRGKQLWYLPIGGVALLSGALVWTMPKPVAPEAQAANAPKIAINDIMPILQQRCVECHSAKPTLMGSAPAGVMFDTPDEVSKNAQRIYEQAVRLKAMPIGNVTHMTDDERVKLAAWFEGGAVK